MYTHRSVRFILLFSLMFGGVAVILAQEPGSRSGAIDFERSESFIAKPLNSKNAADPPAKSNPTQSTSAATPLSARGKLKYSFRQAFADPAAYVGPALGAFLTERRDVKRPGKTSGDKFADGMSYYARGFATNTSMTVFGSGLYPILFKQDPRYKPSHKHGFVARAAYAASRTVVTDSDKGAKQFNASYLLGNLTGAGLANFYERDTVRARNAQSQPIAFYRHVGVGPTFATFGVSTALGAATNIAFNEFDVLGKLRKLLHK
jgi:hypothetical protein